MQAQCASPSYSVVLGPVLDLVTVKQAALQKRKAGLIEANGELKVFIDQNLSPGKDVCWKYNTAERKQFRRLLECVGDNFLTQLVSEPTREGAPLDLLFVKDLWVVGGHLGHSDHEMIDFSIPGESPLGGSPEVQRHPGRLDILQEGNLKGAGAGHPHVLKDEPAGKTTSLAEQESFGWNSGKKGVYDLWKKGQATQEDYKDVMRLCREKSRRSKAQLELNLATAIKDNKKCFYKYISNKRRAKENLHPLLDAGGGT
ncbi:hypothetical protein QYF61_025657 [Mycteria americana]|uniref:Uncharacterized protein n=1 Tax=Mycteria americana TaxID=33587 RepID=A0AAN7S5G5_MYCAM|nr:hypothetical protein QYF61_025657 [Mycteria americana]